MSVLGGREPEVTAIGTMQVPVPMAIYMLDVCHTTPDPALLPYTPILVIGTIQLIVSSLQTFAGPLG